MTDLEIEIQNNELVKMLLESIGDGIFILNNQGRIVAWNPAMERITGFKQSEVLNQNCRVLNFCVPMAAASISIKPIFPVACCRKPSCIAAIFPKPI